MASAESAQLRKLAAVLLQAGEASDAERLSKAAHALCAAKGLTLLKQKVRGWYEPLP